MEKECKYSNRVGEFLKCSVLKDYCLATRRCPTKNNKVVNIDFFEERCKYYIAEESRKQMQKGLYKVLFAKRGRLYVEINEDCVQGVDVPKDFEYDGFVELVKVKDVYYIKGTEPKEIKETKKVYKKELKDEER